MTYSTFKFLYQPVPFLDAHPDLWPQVWNQVEAISNQLRTPAALGTLIPGLYIYHSRRNFTTGEIQPGIYLSISRLSDHWSIDQYPTQIILPDS